MSKNDTLTAWTTTSAGDPLTDWPRTVQLWEDREDARDNALGGGHRLIKLTLKIVKAEEETP